MITPPTPGPTDNTFGDLFADTSDTTSDIIPQTIGATSSLVSAPLETPAHLPPHVHSLNGSGHSGVRNGSGFVNGGKLGEGEDDEDVPRPGEKKMLNGEDVWSLPPTFLHRNLFMKYLTDQKQSVIFLHYFLSILIHNRPHRHPNQTLLWFLIKSNSLDLIIDVTMELWKASVG